VDKGGYGFIGAVADWPISATWPPPILIITNSPADAILLRRARTFDLKSFTLETGECTRD
jgi:hypothetical protein